MDISESSALNLYPTESATVLEFQECTVKVYIPSLEKKYYLLDASYLSC